jgi:PAS domain S-box-containing protein
MVKTFYEIKDVNILYLCNNQKEIENILNKSGKYIKDSYIANTAEQVLDIFQNKSINTIILEDNNWINIATTIRKSDKKVSIIVISDFKKRSELFSAIDLKIDQYLQTPYDAQELIEKLEIIRDQNIRKINDTDIKKFENQYSQNLLVCKVDSDSNITFVNDKLCKIFGYEESELLGKKESIFWHKSENNYQKNTQMFKSLKKDRFYKGISIFSTKNGDSLVVDITSFTISDFENNPTSYVLIYNDITEFASYRKVLETRLNSNKKSYKKKNHFFNEYQKALSLGSSICRINEAGEITYANDSFYNILKSDFDNLIGENYFNICKFHEGINDTQGLREHKSIDNSYSASISHTNSKGESVYHSCIYVPILDIQGELIETVCFHHDQTDIYELNNEIIDTQKELIYTLAEVTERRSNETGNHIKRVAAYCEVLAKSIGLNGEAEYIKIGSTMHDVGKIAINDEILKKPAKLTEDEFKQMKKHAIIGYNILKKSDRPILKAAAIMAKEHHEKWDGSGYPMGLKGEEIHLYGRIVAIADVFDALGSDRVYKKAWDMKRVIAYFKENSGKHFDPSLVKVMFDNFDKFLEIKNKYVD